MLEHFHTLKRNPGSTAVPQPWAPTELPALWLSAQLRPVCRLTAHEGANSTHPRQLSFT